MVYDASEAERYHHQLPQRNRIRPFEHVHGIRPCRVFQSEAQLIYLHQFHPVDEKMFNILADGRFLKTVFLMKE